MTNRPRRFRVLVLDNCDAAGVEILRGLAEVDVLPSQQPDALAAIIDTYDALVVRSATKVTEKVIEAGTQLKIIGRAGVGVDNVAVHAATAKGILVVNSPQGNTVAAAEHTVGLMLACARRIAAADSSVRAGKWERSEFVGCQLQHRTLGIVGLGQVGSHVATIAKGLGMRLQCYDPYVNKARAAALECRPVDTLQELLSCSDVVTLHVPLIAGSKPLIGAEQLAMMKNTALLINCSRGGLVDETALCETLAAGRLAGAALDVFVTEAAMRADSPLLHPALKRRLVLTPHLGASTAEAQVNVAVDVALQVRKALLGGVPAAAVNLAGVRPSDLSGLGRLVTLANTLGSVCGQLIDGAIECITVEVQGKYSASPGSNVGGGNEQTGGCEALLLAAASGALSVGAVSGRANFVNVRAIARERQVALSLVHKTPGPALVTVSLQAKTSITLGGSITSNGGLLLQSFDGTSVYILLKPELRRSTGEPLSDQENSEPPSPSSIMGENSNTYLYTRHADKPSVLGSICSTLGSFGVNISNCHLGRKDGSDEGIAIFQVEGGHVSDFPRRVMESVVSIKDCKVFAA